MGTKVTSRHPRESGLREEEPEDISTKRTKMLKSQGKRTYWSPRQRSAGQGQQAWRETAGSRRTEEIHNSTLGGGNSGTQMDMSEGASYEEVDCKLDSEQDEEIRGFYPCNGRETIRLTKTQVICR